MLQVIYQSFYIDKIIRNKITIYDKAMFTNLNPPPPTYFTFLTLQKLDSLYNDHLDRNSVRYQLLDEDGDTLNGKDTEEVIETS